MKELFLTYNYNCKGKYDYYLNCIAVKIKIKMSIGTSGWRCSRPLFGCFLATTLVNCYFHHSFPFHFPFSPSQPFSHRTAAPINKIIQTPFQTLPAIFGPHSGHFGFCIRCGVVGVERVPPHCQVSINNWLFQLSSYYSNSHFYPPPFFHPSEQYRVNLFL